VHVLLYLACYIVIGDCRASSLSMMSPLAGYLSKSFRHSQRSFQVNAEREKQEAAILWKMVSRTLNLGCLQNILPRK